jgi:hypothetical protein
MHSDDNVDMSEVLLLYLFWEICDQITLSSGAGSATKSLEHIDRLNVHCGPHKYYRGDYKTIMISIASLFDKERRLQHVKKT